MKKRTILWIVIVAFVAAGIILAVRITKKSSGENELTTEVYVTTDITSNVIESNQPTEGTFTSDYGGQDSPTYFDTPSGATTTTEKQTTSSQQNNKSNSSSDVNPSNNSTTVSNDVL